MSCMGQNIPTNGSFNAGRQCGDIFPGLIIRMTNNVTDQVITVQFTPAGYGIEPFFMGYDPTPSSRVTGV